MRLAMQAGIEAVTAEAIASEAGVSTRTFHNYFASKEDAVLHRLEADVTIWVARLAERPQGEPIWDSLEAVVQSVLHDPVRDLDVIVAEMALIESSPALLARKLQLEGRVGRILGEAIADRTGTDIDTDLYPNLLQMTAGSACKAAIELWIHGDTGHSSPSSIVHEAFRMLRAGIPQPLPRTAPAAHEPPVP
ncbi:TetR/AcrR family transcriptional regulator [Rhodococcus sp. NPDC003318]|uniref:TetR/AcrR family transcriptional regulator n=1 Tax=Rhodococcus sp. NPDC003318 TaxID=3364503 RepID=UPI0036C9DBB9